VIPITQTRTGENGNCVSACLASILELPLQLVPDFAAETDSDDEFFAAVDKWLASKGLCYRHWPIGGPAPVGWHTIEGTSPRGGQHAVVAQNGKPVWDPHPEDGTGRGLVKPKWYGMLEPTARVMDGGVELTTVSHSETARIEIHAAGCTHTAGKSARNQSTRAWPSVEACVAAERAENLKDSGDPDWPRVIVAPCARTKTTPRRK